MNTSSQPSSIIEQRIRNRIIEFLEAAITFEDDPHPRPYDVNELINHWYDWVPDSPGAADFSLPVYTEGETTGLIRLAGEIGCLCDATPNSIQDEKRLFQSTEWKKFVTEAQSVLSELTKRGKLSEERVGEF